MEQYFCMNRLDWVEESTQLVLPDLIWNFESTKIILANNSRTHTGKKWEETNSTIITNQRKFSPHNQNHSKAEQRMHSYKQKGMHILQSSEGILCYALIFVVECLNHTVKKKLAWNN